MISLQAQWNCEAKGCEAHGESDRYRIDHGAVPKIPEIPRDWGFIIETGRSRYYARSTSRWPGELSSRFSMGDRYCVHCKSRQIAHLKDGLIVCPACEREF